MTMTNRPSAALRRLNFADADSGSTYAESERAAAKTRGYAEGYSAGSVAAAKQARARQAQMDESFRVQTQAHQQQHQAAVEALSAAADALASRVVPTLHSVDDSLVEAALELAEAILGSELHHGEHSAAAALRRATATVETSGLRAVRMHPETAAALPAEAAKAAGVTIQHDTQLSPGDAVADLSEGFLDARITATLARCKALLIEGQS